MLGVRNRLRTRDHRHRGGARMTPQVDPGRHMIEDLLAGRISRREFVRRAALAGLGVGGVSAALAATRPTPARAVEASFENATVELWSWNGATNYEQVFDDA